MRNTPQHQVRVTLTIPVTRKLRGTTAKQLTDALCQRAWGMSASAAFYAMLQDAQHAVRKQRRLSFIK